MLAPHAFELLVRYAPRAALAIVDHARQGSSAATWVATHRAVPRVLRARILFDLRASPHLHEDYEATDDDEANTASRRKWSKYGCRAPIQVTTIESPRQQARIARSAFTEKWKFLMYAPRHGRLNGTTFEKITPFWRCWKRPNLIEAGILCDPTGQIPADDNLVRDRSSQPAANPNSCRSIEWSSE